MNIRLMKVYADTSVYGGAFDEEFENASLAFFKQVRLGLFGLVVSPIVEQELIEAPDHVRQLFAAISSTGIRELIRPEALLLQEAYLRAGIVTPQSETDALHVALATVTGCQIIVSWNFRHIVHFDKITMYNATNIIEGYSEIRIHTPQEVIAYENEGI